MKAPADRAIAFTFKSHPMRDPAACWTARLVFPAGAVAATRLAIQFVDGNGAPVPTGVFEFAGQRLAVRDGAATISYADFVKGKHESSLWLHRPGQPPVPGGLTFA